MTGRLLACVFLLVGCGGDDDSDGSPSPISSQALTGTVGGQPFTAKVALAKKAYSSDKKKSISIYDVDGTCEKPPLGVERSVFANPIWEVGAKQELLNSSFNTPGLIGISESSDIEILAAPTEIGAKGRMRIRASYKTDSIEGEIEVTVCE